MRSLVVYYSRTGMTKKVAEAISKMLGSDIEEIIDKRNRSGPKGYFLAGRDAIKRELTEIEGPNNDPSAYGVVIIGTPVWAFTMTPAIRTYIAKNRDHFKKIAFFSTQGGFGKQNKFKDMEELCGKKPEASFDLLTKEVAKETYEARLEDFVDTIRHG